MMKQFITTLIFCIPALCFLTCNSYQGYESCNKFIYIQNNSADRIYFAYTMKEGFFNTDLQYNEIYAKGKGVIKSTADFECWERYINQTSGYIYIYLFDAKYVESTPWEEAKKNYLKKYALTVDDLIKAKWTITYE